MVMCMLPLFEGPLLLVLTHIEADELLPALFEAALQLLQSVADRSGVGGGAKGKELRGIRPRRTSESADGIADSAAPGITDVGLRTWRSVISKSE